MKNYLKIIVLCQFVFAILSLSSAVNLEDDDFLQENQSNAKNLRHFSDEKLKAEKMVLKQGIEAFKNCLQAEGNTNRVQYLCESKQHFKEATLRWKSPLAYVYLSRMGDEDAIKWYLTIFDDMFIKGDLNISKFSEALILFNSNTKTIKFILTLYPLLNPIEKKIS